MKKFVSVLICIIISVFGFVGCSDSGITGTDETVSDISNGIKSSDLFYIDTAYCELAYPSKWEEYLLIDSESQTDTVRFIGKFGDFEVSLFDVLFNNIDGTQIGTVSTDDGIVTVSVIMYEYDNEQYSDKYYDLFCAMCDDVNVIIANLNT